MGRPTLPPKFCSIEECGEPVRARGWCNVHYRRWLRTGDPILVKVIHGDTEARFWSKVIDLGTCWVFTGHLNETGYGMLGVGGNKNQLAHRWSYEHFVGPIPDGLVIDHLCRVRNCVNPKHLEPVTIGENSARSPLAGVNKTHCINGHEYTTENTQIVVTRVCRACRSDVVRHRIARLKKIGGRPGVSTRAVRQPATIT